MQEAEVVHGSECFRLEEDSRLNRLSSDFDSCWLYKPNTSVNPRVEEQWVVDPTPPPVRPPIHAREPQQVAIKRLVHDLSLSVPAIGVLSVYFAVSAER